MRGQTRTLKSKTITSMGNRELIEYEEGETIVVAYEFNIFNIDDSMTLVVKFNGNGDELELEPGEGFETNMPITSVVTLTDGVKVKYSYWR